MEGKEVVVVDFQRGVVTEGPPAKPHQVFGREELIEMAVQSGLMSYLASDRRDYAAAGNFDALYDQYCYLVGADEVTKRGIYKQVIKRIGRDDTPGPKAC